MTKHPAKALVAAAIALFLWTISAPIISLAADLSPERESAAAYIRASESAWAEQAVTNDVATLERILAPDYIGVSSSSKVVTKASEIAEAKAAKGPSNVVSNKVDYVDLHFISDELVLAQGMESWITRSGKQGRNIWLDTWLKRDGQWQIIGSQDTRLPPKK